MRRILLALLISAFALATPGWSEQPRRGFPPAPAAAPQAAATTPAEPLRTAGDRPVDIQHLALDLKVDLPHQSVDGRATLRFRTMRPLGSFALDAVDFEIRKVTLQRTGDGDERPNPFTYDGRQILVVLDPSWPAGAEGTLRINYRIHQPKQGLYFFGPTATEPQIPLMVWSQGESVTNRYWIPCLDQPNQRQTTELTATAPEGYEVISNGRLIERRTNPSEHTVTFHWREEHPHPAYLVSLVVGKFDVVRQEWEGLPVLYYVPPGRQADARRAFARTPQMLAFFSQRFGIRYPWEKYAQVVVEQFSAGGMENTTATTLTDRALFDERAALDTSSDSLVSHELAHQWWGDMVTCRDWAHLWLNEGFASYCEAVWAEHQLGADEFAYNMLLKARTAMAGDKDRPVVDRRYASPDSMFDARAYPKGAWVLHMLRRRLGDEAFWKSVQAYGTAHKFQSVETTDLRTALEQQTGRDLERFFYDWTERAGHPVLEVSTQYAPDTKQARVSVKQTQPGEPFHFPLRLAFYLTSDAEAAPSAGAVYEDVEVTDKEHTFVISLPQRPARVEVDPEQALLAEIKETKGRELWRAQLRQSSPAIMRIRAAQHLGSTKTAGDREVLIRALPAEKFWGVQAEIATALADSGGDAARDALIGGLKLPHPKTRRACAEQLAKFRRDPRAAAALKELLDRGDPSYHVEAAALTSYAALQPPDAVKVLTPWLEKPSYNEVLRSAALQGLGKAEDLGALETLLTWTQPPKPRACRAAALQGLAALAHSGKPGRPEQRRITDAMIACLQGESRQLKMSVLFALREMGRSAAAAVAALEEVVQHESDDRVRDLARRAVEQIRSESSLPSELNRIREDLDKLRQDNQNLKERLDRYEKARRQGR